LHIAVPAFREKRGEARARWQSGVGPGNRYGVESLRLRSRAQAGLEGCGLIQKSRSA
jgi:hypothetical protein